MEMKFNNQEDLLNLQDPQRMLDQLTYPEKYLEHGFNALNKSVYVLAEEICQSVGNYALLPYPDNYLGYTRNSGSTFFLGYLVHRRGERHNHSGCPDYTPNPKRANESHEVIQKHIEFVDSHNDMVKAVLREHVLSVVLYLETGDKDNLHYDFNVLTDKIADLASNIPNPEKARQSFRAVVEQYEAGKEKKRLEKQASKNTENAWEASIIERENKKIADLILQYQKGNKKPLLQYSWRCEDRRYQNLEGVHFQESYTVNIVKRFKNPHGFMTNVTLEINVSCLDAKGRAEFLDRI